METHIPTVTILKFNIFSFIYEMIFRIENEIDKFKECVCRRVSNRTMIFEHFGFGIILYFVLRIRSCYLYIRFSVVISMLDMFGVWKLYRPFFIGQSITYICESRVNMTPSIQTKSAKLNLFWKKTDSYFILCWPSSAAQLKTHVEYFFVSRWKMIEILLK